MNVQPHPFLPLRLNVVRKSIARRSWRAEHHVSGSALAALLIPISFWRPRATTTFCRCAGNTFFSISPTSPLAKLGFEVRQGHPWQSIHFAEGMAPLASFSETREHSFSRGAAIIQSPCAAAVDRVRRFFAEVFPMLHGRALECGQPGRPFLPQGGVPGSVRLPCRLSQSNESPAGCACGRAGLNHCRRARLLSPSALPALPPCVGEPAVKVGVLLVHIE